MADKEKEPEGKDKSASSDKDLTDLTSSLRSENPAGRYASAAQKAMDAEENSWKGAGGYRYILEPDKGRIRILDQNGQTTYAKKDTPAYDAIIAEKEGPKPDAGVNVAPNLAEAAGEATPSGAPALTDTAKASGVDLGADVPPPSTKPSMPAPPPGPGPKMMDAATPLAGVAPPTLPPPPGPGTSNTETLTNAVAPAAEMRKLGPTAIALPTERNARLKALAQAILAEFEGAPPEEGGPDADIAQKVDEAYAPMASI